MQSCSSVVVIIPALNEEESLPRVLADLPQAVDVIVVDNGSTDATVAFKQAFPGVRDVSVAEFIELIERRPLVIVDVRPKEERDVSMIPNAVSEDWFEEHRDQYRDKLVVTYCTIGARSGKYAVALQREGFDVVNLRDSILVWAHEGQPLVANDGPTNRVHVYSADWNLLPAGYEAVW